MKYFLTMAISLMAVQAYAYKIANNYVIFERGDDNIVQQYKVFLQRNGVNLRELPRSDFSKEQYARLDYASQKLHETYLSYFNTTEEKYPKPYVIFELGQYSANFSAPTKYGYLPSNFISLSVNHISNDDGMWSILAHEMAHYYHKHATAHTKFIRASYTEQRELTEDNSYGMDIENNQDLADKLDQILLSGRTYEGNRSSVANLTKVRIGSTDPMIRVIAKEYTKVAASSEMACTAVINQLNDIIKKGELLVAEINALNDVAKNCSETKDGKVQDLLKYFYKPQLINFLMASPQSFLTAPSVTSREVSKSIMAKDHPIVTGLKMIAAYRTELKDLVNSIDWESLQFYTHEDEADITAFKILNELGIAHYQLNMLDFVFNKNKCVDSINDAEVEVEYFGATELDTHHSSCWRVYRTMQMLNKYSKGNVNLN